MRAAKPKISPTVGPELHVKDPEVNEQFIPNAPMNVKNARLVAESQNTSMAAVRGFNVTGESLNCENRGFVTAPLSFLGLRKLF